MASLPSERNSVIESSEFAEAVLAPPSRPTIPEGLVEPPRTAPAAPVVITPNTLQDNEPPRPVEAEAPEPVVEQPVEQAVDKPVDKPVDSPVEKAEDRVQSPVDGDVTEPAVATSSPASAEPAPPLQAAAPSEAEAEAETAEEPETPAEPAKPAETAAAAPTPLFRNRSDLAKPSETPIQAIVPIMRPPDDPGVEDDDQPRDEFAEQIAPKAQAGGWRGFWSRFGG
ncbi:conserved hypothetical protein [Bradyrhizobium sp. ORS 375]|nr:conserved hypothetical protein [Bradyrhizobium sp. ORS 375]